MYIFFLALIAINAILYLNSNLISKYLNIYDKNTNVSLLGGLIFYINFFLLFLFVIYNPDHFLLDGYFKKFYIDQNTISYREVFLFFFLPTSFFFFRPL